MFIYQGPVSGMYGGGTGIYGNGYNYRNPMSLHQRGANSMLGIHRQGQNAMNRGYASHNVFNNMRAANNRTNRYRHYGRRVSDAVDKDQNDALAMSFVRPRRFQHNLFSQDRGVQ